MNKEEKRVVIEALRDRLDSVSKNTKCEQRVKLSTKNDSILLIALPYAVIIADIGEDNVGDVLKVIDSKDRMVDYDDYTKLNRFADLYINNEYIEQDDDEVEYNNNKTVAVLRIMELLSIIAEYDTGGAGVLTRFVFEKGDKGIEYYKLSTIGTERITSVLMQPKK